MAQLVTIGKGTRTHLRTSDTGVQPNRARCEVDSEGDPNTYKDRSGNDSKVHPAPPGSPTCEWCRTRVLPA